MMGDRLRWQGPKGAMTPALRAALVANKAEVRRRLGPQRPAKRGGLADGPGGGDSPSSAGGGICHQVEGVKGRERAGGDPLPIQDLEALLAELERLETSADRTDERIDALMAKWERLSPPPSGDNAGDQVARFCHQVEGVKGRERAGGDPLPIQDLEALLAELERLETSADRTDDRIDALMAKWDALTRRLSPP